MRFERVAVTGGSGRLGAHVVAALKDHCSVTVLDRAPPEADVPFVRADILDPHSIAAAIEGHDAVVHLAGIDLDEETRAQDYLTTNVAGTWNVLEAAESRGVRRVVLCSSITATGLGEARGDHPPLYLPVDEDHPLRPHHPYGVSKRLMETVGEAFRSRGGLEVLNLRLMLVLLSHNYDLARRRAADPDCRWLFYYITPEDAARAFRCALSVEAPPVSTFFITACDTCHAVPTLKWMERALGHLPEVRDAARYDRNPRASVFCGERARQHLGFEPASDWPALLNQHEETAT